MVKTKTYCVKYRVKRIISTKKDDKCRKFLEDQKHEMEVHKWIESEKAKKDLGDPALIDWVEKYAKTYREYWEKIHGKIIEDENGMCCSGCKGK